MVCATLRSVYNSFIEIHFRVTVFQMNKYPQFKCVLCRKLSNIFDETIRLLTTQLSVVTSIRPRNHSLFNVTSAKKKLQVTKFFIFDKIWFQFELPKSIICQEYKKYNIKTGHLLTEPQQSELRRLNIRDYVFCCPYFYSSINKLVLVCCA